MNNIDKQYQYLLQDILDNGVEKKDRTGTGTISVFGRQIRHKMNEGFPLLTTKKMHWKSIVTELLWFLRGDTNIKFLLDYDCHICWGERRHDNIANEYFIGIDQIQNLINELKTNPDSRRLMVSAWNVGELDQMVLPPCHYGFQCYVREGKYLSLMWNQRSVDTFLGLPFNIASYGLLLEIIAKEVNMIPDELIGNLGDTHLYLNHINQAKEQITRIPYELPTVQITERNWYMHEAVKKHLGEKTLDEKLKSYRPDCFELIDYQSHPKIKAPLSN